MTCTENPPLPPVLALPSAICQPAASTFQYFVFQEGHSWQRQVCQQRQRGQNMERVHRKWPVLGVEGRVSGWRRGDAVICWDTPPGVSQRPQRLRGWTWCSSGLSTSLWGMGCGMEARDTHCSLRAQARPSYSLYCRAVRCPFSAPGWLSEALEESYGGLKV